MQQMPKPTHHSKTPMKEVKRQSRRENENETLQDLRSRLTRLINSSAVVVLPDEAIFQEIARYHEILQLFA